VDKRSTSTTRLSLLADFCVQEIDFSKSCRIESDASDFDRFFDCLVEQVIQRNPDADPRRE